MNTEVLTPTPEAIARAAELVRAGEVVGFPTETVYGLGANALDAEAVEKIFIAKGRPGDNPLIAHIAARSELAGLVSDEVRALADADGTDPLTPLCRQARALMDAYWPGPMTLIFPKSERVPARVTAGLATVAVRMPSHPVARALIRAAGVPVAAPSANRSGRPSPTMAADVLEDMAGRIPLILDGGACEVGLESTVIDLTGAAPRILRPGGITRAQIEAVTRACEVDRAVLSPLGEGERPRSPGMKYKHYAPRGEVTVFRGARAAEEISRRYDQSANALILALEGNLSRYGARRTLSLGPDAAAMAARLFQVLREADRMGAEVILSECVPPTGVGLAVMNRLLRAAAFRVVDCD